MTDEASASETLQKVVVNDAQQYSLWRADRDNPAGWRDAGRTGSRQECLDYVAQVWTDMTPPGLRPAASS